MIIRIEMFGDGLVSAQRTQDILLKRCELPFFRLQKGYDILRAKSVEVVYADKARLVPVWNLLSDLQHHRRTNHLCRNEPKRRFGFATNLTNG